MTGRGVVSAVGQQNRKINIGWLFLVLLLVANRGNAAEERNLILDASLGVRYDDNLFRLPKRVAAIDGRGDTIITPTATLGYQKAFSKQRIRLNASAFSPRYEQHDSLNYHGYRLSTDWQGQVGTRLLPSLGYSKSYELSSYEDVRAGIMDMLTRQRFTAGLFYGRVGRVRVGADGWQEQKRHGSHTYDQLDLNDSGLGLQSSFHSHRGSSVTLRYESQWIDYQQAVAQVLDYRLDKLRLSLAWPVSSKLALTAVGGYFGRLAPEKGIVTLLRAVARAGVRLKVAGTGPLEADLHQLQAELGADAEFLGYRSGSALHQLIQQSRAVVLPSEWYENAPMSVLESFAMGKPVLGARIGGIPEMVLPEQTGWTFTSGDEAELADRLAEVQALPDSAVAQLGQQARQFVMETFNRQRYVDATLALYSRLGVENDG